MGVSKKKNITEGWPHRNRLQQTSVSETATAENIVNVISVRQQLSVSSSDCLQSNGQDTSVIYKKRNFICSSLN